MTSIRKAAAGAALAVTTVVLLAAPALAHVEVDPQSAAQGSTVTISFHVPNEMDNANTVSVDVKFPDDHPIAVVDPESKPGWTAQVTTKPLPKPIQTDDGQVTQYVSEILWTGGQIKPGEFDEFSVSAGPLPTDVDSLAFPTIQGYDNGQQVQWIQKTVEGQPEPDHPAPVLKLTPAAPSSESSTGSTSSSAPSASSAPASNSSSAPSSTTVTKEADNTLAIIAIVLAAIALIVSIAALARAGRTPGGPASHDSPAPTDG